MVPFGHRSELGCASGTAPASRADSTYGEVITAASTRPSASAWGICGNGMATYSVPFAPASVISFCAPMRLMLESWTTATFLPPRSFRSVIPLSFEATSALASRSGEIWPSMGETHLTSVPWELAFTSTGVVRKPNCCLPATIEATIGVGAAAFSVVTFRPCFLKMPFFCARKSTAFGVNGTIPTVTSVRPPLPLDPPASLLLPLPQAAVMLSKAAIAMTLTPLRTCASRTSLSSGWVFGCRAPSRSRLGLGRVATPGRDAAHIRELDHKVSTPAEESRHEFRRAEC